MKHITLFLLMASAAFGQIIGSAQNLVIACQSNTVVTATSTYCDVRNTTATVGLQNVSVTGDISTNGANGLDTGSVTSSTWYAVLIITHDDGSSPAMLFTTDPTSPTMPTSYSMARHVDWERTDGSANLIPHLTTQTHHAWSWVVDTTNATQCAAVNATSNATFTTIDASAFAPPTSQILYGALKTSHADPVAVRATGYGSGATILTPATGMVLVMSQTIGWFLTWIPMDEDQQFDIVDGGHTTSFFVSGFDTGLGP